MEAVRARAALLKQIRAFFDDRGVLEVDTPALSRAAATDPAIDSFAVDYHGPDAPPAHTLYLHTSPEFPMKRLLAAGSGPIYQLCKVFRDGEAGRLHNPEFTMLEWYRPGMDHHQLMDEVELLVAPILNRRRTLGMTERISYAQAFERHVGIDPHEASRETLVRCAHRNGLSLSGGLESMDRDGWLDLLLTQLIEPRLGADGLCFVFDYPPSQAALARIRDGAPPVAERFELYFQGMELANGFHELLDAREQRRRFDDDRARRQAEGRRVPPMDEHLLAALAHGLEQCAGVALGVERLLMAAMGRGTIRDVLSFPIDRA